MARIDTFLELAIKQGGSDLHMVSGEPPRIRIHGLLHRVRFRDLSPDDVAHMLTECMTEKQADALRARFNIDFAYEAEGLGRFRVNAYLHAGGLAATFRYIPAEIRTLATLDLPPSVKTAISQPRGLVLVTGPTGSGKSTTLAAMVDDINDTRKGHVITIEDPIEFVHSCKCCVVTQRQIGEHAPSFAQALRNALREDPDTVMVGEMRDLETIGLALTAAETGIQVLATLHTTSAIQSIDRIVDVFPAGRQDQVRSMLADSLRMVISQRLVRKVQGDGRVLAAEVLLNTHAAGSLIRGRKSHQLGAVIQTGVKDGMQSLDGELKALAQEGVISGAEAYRNAVDKSQLESFARRMDDAA